MSQRFIVKNEDQGMTLLAFLRKHCTKAPSVKALKRAIDSKRCTINGRVETFSTHPLHAGDQVVIDLQEGAAPSKPEILWQDEFLIAYNKPAGITSEPKHFKGHLVHRLDKETSGVILIAKSKAILEKMIELFRSKDVNKTYYALVDGVVRQAKGKIVSKLAPKHRFQGQTVYGSSGKGEYAETQWVRVSCGPKATLLKCFPITGRTHQIRVHLMEAGHPIVGDYHYCKHFKCGLKATRHLLHALEISFPHPVTQEKITIKAPVPQEFLEAAKWLQCDII